MSELLCLNWMESGYKQEPEFVPQMLRQGIGTTDDREDSVKDDEQCEHLFDLPM